MAWCNAVVPRRNAHGWRSTSQSQQCTSISSGQRAAYVNYTPYLAPLAATIGDVFGICIVRLSGCLACLLVVLLFPMSFSPSVLQVDRKVRDNGMFFVFYFNPLPFSLHPYVTAFSASSCLSGCPSISGLHIHRCDHGLALVSVRNINSPAWCGVRSSGGLILLLIASNAQRLIKSKVQKALGSSRIHSSDD